MKRSQLKELQSAMLLLVFLLIIMMIIFRFSFIPITIQGHSMSPLIKDQERGFSNTVPIKIGWLHKDDLVVIRMKDSKETLLIKRVVAGPGDTIESANDLLFINGLPVNEPYLNQKEIGNYHQIKQLFTSPFGPVTLKDSEYYVMGDNRPISLDSRHFGPIHMDQIISTGWYRSKIER